MQRLLDAKDQADEGGEAFMLGEEDADGAKKKNEKKRNREAGNDSDSEEEKEKIYETDTQKITAIIDDGEAPERESESEEDEFAGMPALAPADPPKGHGRNKTGNGSHQGRKPGQQKGKSDRIPKGQFEVVKQGHPRHPWQKNKHLGGNGNKRRKLQ